MGRPLAAVCDPAAAATVRALAARSRATGRLRIAVDGAGVPLLAHLYLSDRSEVLELERNEGEHLRRGLDDLLVQTLDSLLLQEVADDRAAYFDRIVCMVRGLTGYDSVMVYRFDTTMDGEVVAQSRASHAQYFLGMRLPVNDIPPQARRLYTLNMVRAIADAESVPSRLVPALNPDTQQPLDMSLSAIRSVSPIHIEYLRNIGVRASMTISLLQDGRLWGMVTCHHLGPKRVSSAVREPALLIRRLVSARLAAARARADDVILMHMHMTLLDGIESTRRIRQESRNLQTHIVATTANAFADDGAACRAAGMNDHVAKPIEARRLFECVLRGVLRD